MKQFLTSVAVFCMMTTIVSCNNGMASSDVRVANESGMNVRKNRSRRTAIDVNKYIDFTITANNAKKFTKPDILTEANGIFNIEGGNSFINISHRDGTVILSSDNAFYEGSAGHNMYAKFSFEVGAANTDCLYLRIGNKNKAQLLIDNQSLVNDAIPDLVVCVPFYGVGRNRLEVSPIMNGFIGMPSGTYWAKQK